LTSVQLDRLAEKRNDQEWLQGALKSAATRFVPLWRNRCLLESGASGSRAVYLECDEAAALGPVRPTLLGSDGERLFFAASLDDRQQEAVLSAHPDSRFLDLRLASQGLDDTRAGILAYAKALHYWQYRNAFCGACGSPNELRSAGHRLVCSNASCGRESFPRIDPAVIVLVHDDEACLLGRNANWPPRRFSTLAGFVEPGESLEDTVVREVFEEAQVRLRAIHYASSQPWPFPSSAMCGFYAEAESRSCGATDEMEEVRWFTADELHAAVRDDEVRLPPPVSIAFRLIDGWYRSRSGHSLEETVRRAGSWLGRKSIE
jgi:NAD+ diphosphatase